VGNNGKVIDGEVYVHETKKWWGMEGLGMNVWEAAVQRARDAFEQFDHVCVHFSGGKDSMATFEATYAAAKEDPANRLPLTVLFYDDEVISWETEAYVRRIAMRPDVRLRWYAVPVKQRNACTSEGELVWYPWAPEDEELWVRPLPLEALIPDDLSWWDDDPSHRPTFMLFLNHASVSEFPTGSVAAMVGIRAGESMVRRGILANSRHDNFRINVSPRLTKIYPVYDWKTKDIWTAARDMDWDYNTTYDLLEMRGTPPDQQRIGTPFGDEPMERLSEWAECFPDIWQRTCLRVPGVATAARYSRTDLYAYEGLPDKPPDATWPEFIRAVIDRHADLGHRARIAKKIASLTRAHYRKTSQPILFEAHPITGLGWKLILTIAIRGDTKNRKSAFAPQGNPEKYALALAQYREEQRAIASEKRATARHLTPLPDGTPTVAATLTATRIPAAIQSEPERLPS
jgi:predicted phosphoadenosine phosphosulfate sulfurtransferase